MEKFSASMIKATTETLEYMAFLEVLPASGNVCLPPEEEALSSALLIHDPIQGELRLLMPKTLLGEICETVYAMPQEELADSVPADLLAEILNTIAGRLLDELIPDETFRLGLPEVKEGWQIFDDSASRIWYFTAEARPFAIIAEGETLLKAFA